MGSRCHDENIFSFIVLFNIVHNFKDNYFPVLGPKPRAIEWLDNNFHITKIFMKPSK